MPSVGRWNGAKGVNSFFSPEDTHVSPEIHAEELGVFTWLSQKKNGFSVGRPIHIFVEGVPAFCMKLARGLPIQRQDVYGALGGKNLSVRARQTLQNGDVLAVWRKVPGVVGPGIDGELCKFPAPALHGIKGGEDHMIVVLRGFGDSAQLGWSTGASRQIINARREHQARCASIQWRTHDFNGGTGAAFRI